MRICPGDRVAKSRAVGCSSLTANVRPSGQIHGSRGGGGGAAAPIACPRASDAVATPTRKSTHSRFEPSFAQSFLEVGEDLRAQVIALRLVAREGRAPVFLVAPNEPRLYWLAPPTTFDASLLIFATACDSRLRRRRARMRSSAMKRPKKTYLSAVHTKSGIGRL